MVSVVGFLCLHHEYHHCVSSVFVGVVFVVVSKRYPFSGHFYRSLEAPRLSNFLDVDSQLKIIIQSRIKYLPI